MSNDIYTYIDKKFNIKVTDYTFKRDYIKEPLQKVHKDNTKRTYWELPYKEDLEYIFYNLKLEKNDVSNILGVHFVKLGRIMKEMNIHILTLHEKEKCPDDFYEIYNIDVNQLKRDYLKEPLYLNRGDYRNEKPYKEDLIYLLDKGIYLDDLGIYFGVGRSCIINWMKECNKRTNIREIPKRNENKSKEIVKKYNIDLSRLSRDYSEINLKIIPNRTAVGYTIETPKKEDLEYLFIELNMGRKDIAQYFNVSEPQIKIWNRVYGIKKEWHQIHQNVVKTRIEMGKPFDSVEEKMIYESLIKIYDKEDVLFHYWSEPYPFNCDFYIKTKDLYIEYQGYGGGHNNRPFLETKEDLEELELLKKKALEGSEMSKRIINAWTIRDPLKRQTAKDNGLNWLEFFNMKDFYEWYEKIN